MEVTIRVRAFPGLTGFKASISLEGVNEARTDGVGPERGGGLTVEWLSGVRSFSPVPEASVSSILCRGVDPTGAGGCIPVMVDYVNLTGL